MEEMHIYINGDFFPESQAKVSVFDHGFLYGDGIFEGIRAYDGRIFRLNEHIDRLYESAKTIKLNIPLSEEQMKEACAETLRRNKIKSGYLRLIVSRGFGKLGLDPRNCEKPTIVIIPAGYVITVAEAKPVKAIIASTRRNPSFCIPPTVKSCNYLNNILARIEALNANADEAIMLDVRGYVSEGAADNIFIIKKGKLITPPLHAGILEGVTRLVTIEIAENLGIQVIDKDITIHELYNSDEAFITGTGGEVQPLIEVDGRIIGTGQPGPITKRISEEFKKEALRPEAGYEVYK
ncbi:MAG: branched-chain-amino-acid transaminase [Nitrososphaeria archaeon]|nr:branched-chain-amino-acid transaminase [Nitrososphaeria archaeon]NIN52228.1 branched-chain-amino-acid transaminase [Nitrososphaeria archaeon]NIQ32681.1 branched-chain-amino-acid transaminase [Nitrososphaeria archaeon]